MSIFMPGPVNVYRVRSGVNEFVGPTEGGVDIRMGLDSKKVISSAQGATPIDHHIVGLNVEFDLPLSGLTITRLYELVIGAEVQTTPSSRLYISNPVGQSTSIMTDRYLLKQIKGGIETTAAVSDGSWQWTTILRAAPLNLGTLDYKKSKQQIFSVTFQCYADPTSLTPAGAAAIMIFGEPPP